MAEDYVWIALYEINLDRTRWKLVPKKMIPLIEAMLVETISGGHTVRGKFMAEPF